VELGPYVDLEPLATGGSSRVLAGLHAPSGARVALKVLLHGPPREELLTLARLAHPGVLEVLDAGVVPDHLVELGPGSSWIVTDLAEGSVAERLPGSWGDARRVLLQVLAALAYVHARGVVHLDLKPDNLLRFPLGVVKVADFGIARLLAGAAAPTGRISGTPGYLSPEQVLGRPLDGRSDLYSLGCLAWRFVCGRARFRGPDPLAVARMHVSAPEPPFEPVIRVPEGLGDWLGLLLARDPDQRFACAADAAAVLRELVLGEDGGARVDAEPPTFSSGALPTLSLDQLEGRSRRRRAGRRLAPGRWRTGGPRTRPRRRRRSAR
jgi:serine/threonine-protein kinase